ncbi:crossover junction endodeoxyribonuclease RuvC, partial [Actinotignum timonense]|uniref:crossover junction endodeoxyribonuclease RuvC n=1 Tax=Actinotignum timonense TaxID=1870995 RepID=UPI002A7F2BD4
MRILGIDPGLTRCGLGTIDADVTRRVRLVDMRVARSPVDLAPHRRLLLIADEIDAVIAEFSPEVVAVERVFAQENVRSVTSTAQVAGIAMLAAARGCDAAGAPGGYAGGLEVCKIRAISVAGQCHGLVPLDRE